MDALLAFLLAGVSHGSVHTSSFFLSLFGFGIFLTSCYFFILRSIASRHSTISSTAEVCSVRQRSVLTLR